MKNPPFVTGCYYHIYNRGVEKRTIFQEDRDYHRFLETVNFYHKIPQAMKLSDFKRGKQQLKEVKQRVALVKIFAYCLMPNHFHLLVQQLVEGGITELMRKGSDSYTKYFNTKYQRVGPLFQGKFKAKLIDSDQYLLQAVKYIHRNSFPLPMWGKQSYPYSSYSFYLTGNQHQFCDTEFVSSYFSKNNPNLSFVSFVEEHEVEDPVLFDSLIDIEEIH